jgi:predicted nucleotidyltransferase
MEQQVQLPEPYRRDINRAVSILKEAGCTHVFLFGSLITGTIRDESDIDLAVRGCPKDKFFHLLGRLMLELDHPVDLVDLDSQQALAHYLEKEGRLHQVV